MAKKRNSEKAQRMLLLLHGVSEPKIRAALETHGFGPDDLDEGWRLLRGLWPVYWEDRNPYGGRVGHRDIDAWENRWFPVIRATLMRHHPAVHDYVFNNLRQTRGQEVYFSVGELVARIRRLETTEPVDDARAARDLLAHRGLTELELQQIEALLDASWKVPASNLPTQEERLAERRAAEEAMWKWYLEWSQIVRAAVKDRNVLRRIGFGGDASSYEPAEGDAVLN